MGGHGAPRHSSRHRCATLGCNVRWTGLSLLTVVVVACSSDDAAGPPSSPKPDASKPDASGFDAGVADSGSCWAGTSPCFGECVDLSSDPKHCGGCGVPCALSEVCGNGVCSSTCPSGTTNCDGACADLSKSTTHCGTCGNACTEGLCQGGKCGCADGVKNGDETDVDCGGSCAPCGAMKACSLESDCSGTLSCVGQVCWQAPPMDADLVGYWRLEGAAGDASAQNNHGTVYGSPFAAGKVGQAVEISNGNCIAIPDSNSLDATGATTLTIMAWVRFDGGCAGDRGIIFNKENSYEVGVSCSGASQFQEAINTSSTPWGWEGTGVVTAGAWTHTAVTWDGATVRHYLDGAEVYSRALSGSLVNRSTGVGIGCRGVPGDASTAGTSFWTGAIDELAMYTRALSVAELSAYVAATK